MSTLNSTILSITRRRRVQGLTVGEIFDRLNSQFVSKNLVPPPYNSVRARVYELAARGELNYTGTRKDTVSGRTSSTFTRPQ